LRESLQNTLAEVDPEGRDPALQRMIVVGHSQGGLLTKLQAISGGSRFWDAFSRTPFEELEIQPDTQKILRKAFFFEAQPFVERVVFISTPHHGSFLAGNWLGRIASSLVRAPTELVAVGLDIAQSGVSVARRAASQPRSIFGWFQDDSDLDLRLRLARLPSSVDNMNPQNPFTVVLHSIEVGPAIRANSIIPVLGTAPPEGQNDGVVEYSSAHIEEAESEYVVYRSAHSTQAHPETIQELRRILLKHIEKQ
jgi:triacylglycerol esterase/lipase EstA (alpha/beta hydrolase family)